MLFNILMAAGASDTLCSFPVFMRLRGIVQTAFSKSISAHFAPITSPVRPAVKIKNSNPNAEKPDRFRREFMKLPI